MSQERVEKIRMRKVGNLYQIHVRKGSAYEGPIDLIAEFAVVILKMDKDIFAEAIKVLEHKDKVSFYGFD